MRSAIALGVDRDAARRTNTHTHTAHHVCV